MLTFEQAAKRTKYHKFSLYRFAASGEFPPPRYRGEHGQCFFATEDIDTFMKTHKGRGPRKRKSRQRRKQ